MSEAIPAIAIVGMAGRFPGAPDVATLWSNLCAGVESVRALDEEELREAGVDAAKPGYVNAVAFPERTKEFDAAFFGMTRREAEITDPQHRMFLETVWEALEHAGQDPGDGRVRTGLFGGVAENYYHRYHLLAHPDLLSRYGFYPVRLASGREYAIMRTAFKLGLTGPAVAVMTACSTSAVATHLAVQSLLAGDCDQAVAGGAHLFLPGHCGYIHHDDSIHSSDGHVRAFDADACGTVMGSGAASIVLKRLEDALADGNTVYALIRGSAVNNDGADKIGFTAPGIEGQRTVIEDALSVADVDAASIGLLEAHGTGTALGDPIEVTALTEAYRRDTSLRQYCAIGSLKSNIGHLDVAAGVTGIIKAALSLHHERIPPNINFRTANPQIDFEASPFFVNTELLEWSRTNEPRRAGVSSFGFGGTNAHIVLEEAPLPSPQPPSADSRPSILTLSAKSVHALDRRQELLADHLTANPDIDLVDAAYTLAVGRSRMPYRSALVVSDPQEAAQLLRSQRPKAATVRTAATGAEVAFLFTGQGAQYLGMGQGLYAAEPVFARAIDECSTILGDLEGQGLTELLFGGGGDLQEASARILQTQVGQPVIVALQYALASLWESWGIHPTALVGHSVGEISAACLGGMLSLEDAIGLAAARGQLMAALPRGAMTAVLAERDVLVPFLDETTSLAAVNAPEQCVVSGPPESVDALEERLSADRIPFRRLPTDRAFHSSMMDPVVTPLVQYVDGLTRHPMRVSMVSTLTGAWIAPEELADADYWGQHAIGTVRFSDAVDTLMQQRPDLVLVEIGPGETLASLVRQHASVPTDSTIISTLSGAQSDTDVTSVRRALAAAWSAGVDVDWEAVTGWGRRRLALPTYPFASDQYWIESAGKPALISTTEDDSAALAPPVAPVVASHQGQDSIGVAAVATVVSVPLNRRERIVAILKSILADLSGAALDDLDPDASFTDLGFDSLFLTQANSQFRERFGIRFTLGQLLSETPTIAALATRIDDEVEPGVAGLDEPAPATGVQAPMPSADQRGEPKARPPGVDGADQRLSANDVERMIGEQLRLMEAQIQLLRSRFTGPD